jgi:hypothetical protein
MEGIQDAYE